jgi:hypothetical protein
MARQSRPFTVGLARFNSRHLDHQICGLVSCDALWRSRRKAGALSERSTRSCPVSYRTHLGRAIAYRFRTINKLQGEMPHPRP